jgi:NTP pyrophosphatase (non-canonical NTP hydrolase)
MRNIILDFAKVMDNELDENDHKTGWLGLSPQWLINRIRQETAELENAIKHKKSKSVILSECADVANFAMMIFDNMQEE